ncbi:MAG TPA: alpha/beta fold hydrolase [Thermoanaerobaculia bacterium]
MASWQTVTKDVLFTLRRTGSKNVRAALFIHGFTGHHEETWINASTGASFPGLLQADTELSDYDVFGFQYRTSAVSGESIKKIARQLADEIEQRMSRYEQIVVIAHSMGGLVAMHYILIQLRAARSLPIRGVMLYAVPINGSHLVSMAKAAGIALKFVVPRAGGLFGWLRGQNEQVSQLAPASEFVQELNDEWALRVVNGGHSSEEAKRRSLLPVRVVTGTKDLVVREVSAKGTYGAIDWHPLDFGHVAVVKPEDATDPRYLKAKDFLVQCRPPRDRFAFLRLREISDTLLNAQSQPLCRNWNYEVHIHGGAQDSEGDELLAEGFSPYVVTQCSYQAILSGKTLRFGFSWGGTAGDDVWKESPVYVHQIFTRALPESERAKLSEVIDDILRKRQAAASWETIFPKLDVAIRHGGKRYELVQGDVERGNSMMLRELAVPAELSEAVTQEVTFDISFRSYAPKTVEEFTLRFPFLHVGFEGLIVVHEDCKEFSVNQYLGGEKEFELKPEYFGNKSQLKLLTEDIVLPGTRVEVEWQARSQGEGGAS